MQLEIDNKTTLDVFIISNLILCLITCVVKLLFSGKRLFIDLIRGKKYKYEKFTEDEINLLK